MAAFWCGFWFAMLLVLLFFATGGEIKVEKRKDADASRAD
jgi:hypothetical protein